MAFGRIAAFCLVLGSLSKGMAGLDGEFIFACKEYQRGSLTALRL